MGKVNDEDYEKYAKIQEENRKKAEESNPEFEN